MTEESKLIIIALIILTLIMAGLQWLLVKFTHWSVALIISGFVSVIISVFYVSISNATPNGAGNSVDFSEYITPTILIFLLFSCSFYFACHLNKIHLPKIAYKIFLGLILLVVIAVIISNIIKNNKSVSYYKENYISCQIEIKNKMGIKPFITSVFFVNELNNHSTSVQLKRNKDINAILHEKNTRRRIPKFCNKIRFLCISSQTNTAFFQDYPMDFSLYQQKKDVKDKSKLKIKLIIKNDKEVDLYINNLLVKSFVLNDKQV